MNGFFYYAKIDKKLGNHIISASAYGAPQQHGQRAYRLPVQQYDADIARELGIPESDILAAKARGIRYNQHWGHLARTAEDQDAEPEPLTERVNQYHKPQFTLKDFWTLSDKFYLSNIAYLSIGNGGGVREKLTISLDSTGHKTFQNIYNRNISPFTINSFYDPQLHAATNHLRKLVNEHFWYGLLSTANYTHSPFLSFSGGVDLRSYKGIRYEMVYDLLGADYVITDFTDKNIDLADPSQHMLLKGDKNNYHYDGLVRWGGLFFQTEYKKNRVSSFINLSGAYSAYKRIDYFKLEPETDWQYFPGFTIKGGANYNFTRHINAFLNLGYLSKAPRFNNVFDYNNKLFREILNEKVRAIEFGSSYSSPRFSLNLNSYYTVWENKPGDMASRIMVEISPGEFEEQSVNINGIDALHMGLELDFIIRLHKTLDVEGLVSLGDWRWNSEDTVRIYDDQQNLVKTQYFDATGVHVGNAAQNNDPFNGQTYNDFDAKSASVFFGLGRIMNFSFHFSF